MVEDKKGEREVTVKFRDINDLRCQVGWLKEKNKNLKEKNKVLEKGVEILANEYYKVFEELKIKNEKLIKENEELKEACGNLNARHFTILQRAEKLEKENGILRDRIKGLKEVNLDLQGESEKMINDLDEFGSNYTKTKTENETLKQKLDERYFINKDGEIESLSKSDYNEKLDKIIEIMESTFRELGFIYQAIKEVK